MRYHLVGLILGAMMLTGCAQMPVMEEADRARDPELVIASDLVNALMQVDGYHPTTTRLQIQKSKHAFGKTLNSVLGSVGYDIQYVDAPMGDRFVQYSLSDNQTSLGSMPKTYHLSVGGVEFKRDYKTIDGRVQPASKLLGKGVDPRTIVLNDHIFGIETQPELVQQRVGTEPGNQTVAATVNQNTYSQTPLQQVNNELPVESPQKTERLSSGIDLLVNGESSPSQYHVGDNLVFTVRTESDARLSCYYRDPAGTVIRIYPNRFASKSTVRAGELVHIPASDEWALQASEAGASDDVMCLSVEPDLQALMAEFESAPDLEPLTANSFDELLDMLRVQTGISPHEQRLSIHVN